MTRPTRWFALGAGLLLCAITLSSPPAAAQEAAEPVLKPRVKLFMSSAERVMEDLEWIVSTLAKEKTQWEENLFPSLDIFLFGVDRAKPIRFDVMIGGDASNPQDLGTYRFQPSIPIDNDGKDMRTFIRENLVPIGIEVRLRSRGGFYSLGGVYEGFMRTVEDYACIGMYESDIPKEMPHPGQSHESLVKQGYDVALEIDNHPAQTEQRAADFAVFQENTLAQLEQRENESDAAFALRQLRRRQSLEKLGGLYEEARRVTVGWITDIQKQTSGAVLYGESLPGMDLEKLIQSLSVEHSVFAVLPVPEDPAFSLRINLPYDEMQKRHLAELYEQSRPVAEERIDEAEQVTSEEKQPAKQVANLLFDMLVEGIEVGRLDAYVDMTAPEGKTHVIVAGVRAANGKKADEIVQLIPQANTGWSVEMNVDSVGDTAIHKIDLSQDLPATLKETFGDSAAIYVGTSEALVWVSGGDGSLDLLKNTITKVNEGELPSKVSPVFGEFKVRLHTLLKLYDGLVVEMGWNPLGQIEIQPRGGGLRDDGAGLQPIDPAEIREIATRATADTDDRISGQARRVENHAEGEINVAPGVLRAIGKIVAKISADNL